MRDTTPPPPTPRLRLPLERALTTRDGRPASRPSRDRLNVFKDYSPADGGDVIKLIHVVYKSFSEHVMDAARRGSLTVRPEVFLDVRHESASFFHARARVFFLFFGRARFEKRRALFFLGATRDATDDADRADSV